MDKQWYVVNTYSGHENKVKEKLEMRAESMDMQDYIFRVVIPEEKVVEVKDGVTKEKVKKMFPGYILVEMVMTDEAWYVVRILLVLLVSLDHLVKVLNLHHYNLMKLIKY